MKTAVVLFNLGGPDSLNAVRPFLFNLFNDRAILRVPQPMRTFLAWLISTRRTKTAQHIYAQLGGKSPILEQTQAQTDALQKTLGDDYRVFICMRYWHPFAADTAKQVQAYAPDKIILLPLYPQFSTTTTSSSFNSWPKLTAPTVKICTYAVHPQFIAAHAALLREALAKANGDVRVLFSAHGLPEKIIEAGDPYQRQVEQTVAAIVAQLGMPGLDYVTCYQSRVGPLKWIGPATDAEIKRAGADGKSLVVVPVAFVSEHSETLVELDIEYAALAKESGVPSYTRVPALQTHPEFIECLKQLCLAATRRESVCCGQSSRCPL